MKGKVHARVTTFFRVSNISNWEMIRAVDILAVNGVGQGYLNKLRLWLAHQDVSLKEDHPPAFWLKIMQQRVVWPKEAGPHNFGICPFTIIIDSNEQFPFTFDSMKDKEGNTCVVETVREPLWTLGLADYSIKGLVDEFQIERKSKEDLVSTLSSRRDNFEEEIHRLDGRCSFAAVVVECEWSSILDDSHDHGASAKSVSRMVMSWMIKYPRVHWCFCFGKSHAEIFTFRLMTNFWWQHQTELSDMEKNGFHKKVFKKV